MSENSKNEVPVHNLRWKKTLFNVIEDLFREDFKDLARELFINSELYDKSNTSTVEIQQSKQIFEHKGQASRRRNAGQSISWNTLFASLARFGVQPADFRHIRNGNNAFLVSFAKAIALWSGTDESMGYRLDSPESTLYLYLMIVRQRDLVRALSKFRSQDPLVHNQGLADLSRLAEELNSELTNRWSLTEPGITSNLLVAYCTPGKAMTGESNETSNSSWLACCAKTLSNTFVDFNLYDWFDKAVYDCFDNESEDTEPSDLIN